MQPESSITQEITLLLQLVLKIACAPPCSIVVAIYVNVDTHTHIYIFKKIFLSIFHLPLPFLLVIC